MPGPGRCGEWGNIGQSAHKSTYKRINSGDWMYNMVTIMINAIKSANYVKDEDVH